MDQPGSERPAAPQPHAAEPPTLLQRIRTSPMTFALAVVNVVVFLYVESKGSTTEVPSLLRFGAVEQLHVVSGDYWRLVTPMFLHIGWIHLLWNTYASFGWCTAVETAIGRLRFLFVYLAAGIGGAAASAFFHRVTAAGASGAMFGIIGATLILRYRVLGDFKAFTRDHFVRANAVNMAIWTVIGLTAINMDNVAHFGGLATGAAATLALTSARWGAAVGAVLAGLAALGVAAARPGWTPKGEAAEASVAYTFAYARGAAGFEQDAARAARFAELVCRTAGTVPCAQAAAVLAQTDDAAARARGQALLADACAGGVAPACDPAALPEIRLDLGEQNAPPPASSPEPTDKQ